MNSIADLASNMVVSGRRDVNASGFRDAFKSRRNIYVVAKDVMGFNNHVANIDADTKNKALIFSVANRKVMDALLKLRHAPEPPRPHWKLRQEPIASILNDAATCFVNCIG